jgi:peptidoglycan/LPS O-acetylase OafA/YrhL
LGLVVLTAFLLVRERYVPVPGDGPTGRLCLLTFLFGVWVYLYAKSIPFNAWMAAGSAMAVWIIFSVHHFDYLAAAPIAYLTVWLGLQNPRKLLIIAGADYSYGMYLYGFPIQQAVSDVLPQYRHWYVNLPLSLVGALLAAYLSWTLIESVVLRQKRTAIAFVEGRLAWLPRLTCFRKRNRTPRVSC